MRRILLVALSVAVVVGSLSMSVRAQNSPNESQIKACVALGFEPSVCATCLVAGMGNNAQDYGACFCKFDPAIRSMFKTMGECVVWVQNKYRPATTPAKQ